MRRYLSGIIFLLISGFGRNAVAQVDPHFSQYYAYPLWLNPALTGVFNGDARLNVNARQQWSGVGDGYNTGGISADFKPTEKVGIGFNIIDQSAGSAGYNYFAAYGSFGYGIAISSDGTKKLRFGVQAGFINRSFDPNKLEFDDQYNPALGFDPSISSQENFLNTNATVFDANAGIFYYDSDPESSANLFGGVSLAHLNRANDPFAYPGVNDPIPIRFDIHGGIKFRASDDFDITPHFIYIRQQQNQETDLGVYSELKAENNNGLILGAMYRFNDAIVADAGYHLDNLVIGLSYDFNTSALSNATEGHGGFELSLNYIFGSGVKTPAEICPRF